MRTKPAQDRFAAAVSAVIVFCFFLWNAGDGIHARFTPDDLMNLYGAWSAPLGLVLKSAVVFFEPFYRPAGALFYRGIFAFAGLDPFPYRAVCMVFLALNIVLAYWVSSLISESAETGWLTALLNSFHVRMADLYYSSGTVYDVLAYTFFFACFGYYLRIRMRGALPALSNIFVLAGLFILALGSKEVAVTLPVLLLLYEAIWHPSKELSLRAALRWVAREGRPAVLLLAIAGIFAWSRAAVPSYVGNEAYTPVFSLEVYRRNWRWYISQLLLMDPSAASFRSIALSVAVMLLIALRLRSRAMLFGLGMFLIGELPLAFILPRGLFALYLPVFGLALYFAEILVRAIRTGIQAISIRASGRQLISEAWIRVAAPAAVAVALTLVFAPHRPRMFDWNVPHAARIDAMIDQMSEFRFPKDSSVMLLDDPFDADEWTPLFIIRLSLRDPDLSVFRAKTHPQLLAKLDEFSHLVRFEGLRMVMVREPGR
ncbi:MAG: hypothetical protein IRZ15_04440 [Bryobacteraceae bacterium]|nr:hypothetical protein [Bryobacteraceae bacterium]